MPSYTDRQRKFMGAELGRERAGESTETGMSEKQLRDFARKDKRGHHRRHHRGSTRK